MPNSHTGGFFVAQGYFAAGSAFTFAGTFHFDVGGLSTYTPTAQEAAMGCIVIVGATVHDPVPVIYDLTEGRFLVVANDSDTDIQIIGTSGTGATVPAGTDSLVACDGTNWNIVAGGGTVTLAGDVTGPTGANTVVNAHIPAGTTPAIGSGGIVVTPDNASGLADELMAGDNWVHLSTNAATKLNNSFTFSVPATTGNFFRMDVEVHFAQVGATGRMAVRRTVTVLNNAGTLATPTGSTADGDNTPSTWTPSPAIAGSVAAIVMNNGSPGSLDVMATRQAGVDTYARIASVSFAGGSSGH